MLSLLGRILAREVFEFSGDARFGGVARRI